MHGLQIGNDVLKELHREVSLERVEKLMDKTRDGVEYQRVCRPYDHIHLTGSEWQMGVPYKAAVRGIKGKLTSIGG